MNTSIVKTDIKLQNNHFNDIPGLYASVATPIINSKKSNGFNSNC